MTGIVKRFNPRRGYGFIAGDDGKDYFVHQTSIIMNGFRKLSHDTKVQFDVIENEKGLIAINVIPVN